MALYRKKPVVIEAITFQELVEYGLGHTKNIEKGMPWSFTYKGWGITHENDECYLIPTLEGTHRMTPADVLITGVKGEIYPCKRDIFEATYEPERLCNALGLSFGAALNFLKEGRKLARAGWNGKGMFVFLVPGSTFKVNRAPLLGIYPEGTEIRYHAHVDMKTADGQVVPWLASQTDLLAEDWQLVD